MGPLVVVVVVRWVDVPRQCLVGHVDAVIAGATTFVICLFVGVDWTLFDRIDWILFFRGRPVGTVRLGCRNGSGIAFCDAVAPVRLFGQ